MRLFRGAKATIKTIKLRSHLSINYMHQEVLMHVDEVKCLQLVLIHLVARWPAPPIPLASQNTIPILPNLTLPNQKFLILVDGIVKKLIHLQLFAN